MKTIAILLAAGQGKRMQSDVKKQYILIQGKPVLYYPLKVLQDSFIDEIILVSSPGEEAFLKKEFVERYGFDKVKKIVPGGKERYHSVAYGLNAIDTCDYCFIHDGARPFLSEAILERTANCAYTSTSFFILFKYCLPTESLNLSSISVE